MAKGGGCWCCEGEWRASACSADTRIFQKDGHWKHYMFVGRRREGVVNRRRYDKALQIHGQRQRGGESPGFAHHSFRSYTAIYSVAETQWLDPNRRQRTRSGLLTSVELTSLLVSHPWPSPPFKNYSSMTGHLGIFGLQWVTFTR